LSNRLFLGHKVLIHLCQTLWAAKGPRQTRQTASEIRPQFHNGLTK